MQSTQAAVVQDGVAERVSRFDRGAARRPSLTVMATSARASASALKAKHSARIDMVAIGLALAAAALVRLNVIPSIGW